MIETSDCMFDFHNIWFSILYIAVAFICCLGFYFGILLKIVNAEKLSEKKSSIVVMYVVGIFLSGIFAYYLFEIVRFIQYMY